MVGCIFCVLFDGGREEPVKGLGRRDIGTRRSSASRQMVRDFDRELALARSLAHTACDLRSSDAIHRRPASGRREMRSIRRSRGVNAGQSAVEWHVRQDMALGYILPCSPSAKGRLQNLPRFTEIDDNV